MIDDDPVQRRHREDHAERRALRENGGGQRPLLVGKPFVDRMRRHRERRPLAGAEDDAADHQRGETDGADHRKLRHRPDHRHREQHPAGVDAVDDEADDDGRDRKQEEERGAEQAELLRRELQFVHDRRAGEADHDLVGKVHQHEQEQQKRDFPGALGRRLRGHGCFPRFFFAGSVGSAGFDGTRGLPAKATGILPEAPARNCRLVPQARATTGSRSRRGAIETVIRRRGPDMFHAIISGDFHGQIGPSSRMTNGNPSVAGPCFT